MGLEKIEEYKKKLGLTTAELAERSGVPKGTLDKILSGVTKDPKLETLKAIARVLGCSLDEFDDEYVVSEEPFFDVELLIARNGNQFTNEQKIELIRMLSELK